MYKSGQIVFDTVLQEPVIFIEGDGEMCVVVCTGVKDEACSSKTLDLVPIWTKQDKVFTGLLASKSFTAIIEVTEKNYGKYFNYIKDTMTKVSADGKDKEQQFHIKG
jgi:hypothetical protein